MTFTSHRLPWSALALLVLLASTLTAPGAFAAAMSRVSGTVTDLEGSPVLDATVTLENIDGKATTVSQRIKKDGKYFLGTRAGAYKLHVKSDSGLVLRAVKGRAEALDRSEVWAVDQEVSPANPPTINVGTSQEITLDITMGPPPAAAAAAPPTTEPTRADPNAVLEKVKAGRCDEALPDLERVAEQQPDQASSHYLKAYCLQRLERHEEALAAIDRALALDPSFVGARVIRGRSLKALGKTDEAIAELQREVDAAGNAAQVAEARTSLATLYRDLGRTEEAIAVFEALLAAEPGRREYLIELAQLHGKKGDRARAEELLAQADAAGGADPAAMLNLAIGHLNEKEYDKARAIAQKVLAKPDLSPAHQSLGWSLLARCHLNAGEMEEGIASLEKALKLDPSSPLAAEDREILAAVRGK